MEENLQREINIKEYWHVIRKRRWTIYTVVIILVITGTIGSFVAKPTYKATCTLQIERENPKVVSFEEIFTIDSSQQDFYQTQYKLIQSRSLARRVIKNLNLTSRPEFSPGSKVGILGRIRNIFRSNKGEKSEELVNPYTGLIDIFLSRLQVEPIRNSRLAEISFISNNPRLSAEVINAVAEGFIESNLEAKYYASKEAHDFLSKQIEELKKEIASKEEDMQQYAGQKGIIALEGDENIIISKLADLNAEYTRAQTERIAKESYYNQMKNASPDSIPEVLRNPVIQDLKKEYARLEREYAQKSERFKADWPEMVRLKTEFENTKQRLDKEINDIVTKVRKSAESEYKTSLTRESALKEMLDKQKAEAIELQRNSILYTTLKTEVENKRKLLDSLMKREDETGVSAELRDLGTSNIRIVDRAEIPQSAYRPRKKLNIMLSIFVGLMLGTGLAFFLEYLDSSLKNKKDVEIYLNLPTLAIIASLDGLKTSKAYKYGYRFYYGIKGSEEMPKSIEKITQTNPMSSISEAYRSMRTSLLLSSPESPPQVILITSSQPSEGKTITSVNLAITFTHLDKRVLLLEGDLRKPKLARIFNLNKDPGLTSFLTQDIDIVTIIKRTNIANLYVIPSGPLPPNPAELLSSSKFDALIEACRGSFAHIIIDSPPLLAFTDAQLLGNKVDRVILVVKGADTPREAVMLGKEKLNNAKIVGIVLNNLDVIEHHHYCRHYYYYGKKYHYYHGKKYQDKKKQTEKRIL
ncbi:MAG: polysaccharide biosynthesis tyrosine autokinase [Candidatus Aminicenantes bacterium]|nr:polysaccharide biosynthesis tyrosine autokinase [Candidatus Aminicenantes bacterium]